MTGGTGRRSRWMVPALAGAAVLILDQLTKWWASDVLADRTIDLVWTLRLHLVFNTGAAFSLGEGRGALFAVLILLVIALLVRQGASTVDPVARIAVGAIIGGAIGNLADRVFREGGGFFGGAVVDFIDLQWWPVFNVADSAIVVGGILVVWRGWRR